MTELIKIETLSEKIDIPVSTLRKMVMNKEIPHVKLPNRYVRFDVKKIETWLKSRTVEAKAIGQ